MTGDITSTWTNTTIRDRPVRGHRLAAGGVEHAVRCWCAALREGRPGVDRITASFVEEFCEERDLLALDPARRFEAFAALCVVSQQYDEEFDPEDVLTGGGNDLGIDAAALVVNGYLVSSPEEIADLRTRNNYLQASIIVVQAKTSSNFEGAVLADLADNITDLLGDRPTLPMSQAVSEFRSLITALYDNSSAFRRSRPELVLRYVTTGTWNDDAHLVAKREAAATRLRSLNLFDVDVACLGAREVQDLYRQTKNSVEASFEFRDRVPLPDLRGVEEAYIGIAKAPEYLKLIIDAAGNIRKSLFYDNVRDFQDYNPVNLEIRQTLRDNSVQERFVVLNNGVTILAREITPSGNKFTLRDYQIVNGCQTSHVLFDEREHLHEDMYVPVKVIVTQDDDVVSSITTATNRQTNVTEDDLRALDAFQKDLEAFFPAHPLEQRLYYERRSEQYSSIAVPQKTRIVTPPQLVRAYASMFLDEPWRAGRYYKELQKLRRNDIFQATHSPYPYYVSAVAAYRLDFFFRNGLLDVKYKPARYQLLMAVRQLIHGGASLPTGNRHIDRYCTAIADVMWDVQAGPGLVGQLLPAVDAAVAETESDGVLDRDTVRTQQFTDLLTQKVRDLRESA